MNTYSLASSPASLRPRHFGDRSLRAAVVGLVFGVAAVGVLSASGAPNRISARGNDNAGRVGLPAASSKDKEKEKSKNKARGKDSEENLTPFTEDAAKKRYPQIISIQLSALSAVDALRTVAEAQAKGPAAAPLKTAKAAFSLKPDSKTYDACRNKLKKFVRGMNHERLAFCADDFNKQALYFSKETSDCDIQFGEAGLGAADYQLAALGARSDGEYFQEVGKKPDKLADKNFEGSFQAVDVTIVVKVDGKDEEVQRHYFWDQRAGGRLLELAPGVEVVTERVRCTHQREK